MIQDLRNRMEAQAKEDTPEMFNKDLEEVKNKTQRDLVSPQKRSIAE